MDKTTTYERLCSLETKTDHIIKIGFVTEVLPETAEVRVRLPEVDNMVSYKLPVLFRSTKKDKYYSLPDIDEQVLVIFQPNGLEKGFVIGAMYSDVDQVPVTDRNKHIITFEDGSSFEYDTKQQTASFKAVNGSTFEHNSKESTYKIESQDDIRIKCKSFYLETEEFIGLSAGTRFDTRSIGTTLTQAGKAHLTTAGTDVRHAEDYELKPIPGV